MKKERDQKFKVIERVRNVVFSKFEYDSKTFYLVYKIKHGKVYFVYFGENGEKAFATYMSLIS